MTEVVEVPRPVAVAARHARWVRICHWTATASIFTLAVTGFVILMAHPRLYWGDVGNSLTPALLELPISRNHQHGGWVARAAFFDAPGSPVSANRTYDIFNQNGWGRSLHFLAAWFAAVSGLVYLLAGLAGGHFRRYLFPRGGELAPGVVWADVGPSPAPADSQSDRRPWLRRAAEVRLLRGCLHRPARGGVDRPGDVAGSCGRAIRSCACCSAVFSQPARSTSLPSSRS